MKKVISLVLCTAILTVQTTRVSAVTTFVAGAALMETSAKTFLYKKNVDTRLAMASTTKITTAFVALKYGDISSKCVIPQSVVGIEGSSMYHLTAGEVYTLDELLYGLIMASGNDAAAAIAIHIAGSEEEFTTLMNTEAKAMGLSDTHFDNPSGLDSKTHYTTERDIALITAAAIENEDYLRYVKTKSHVIEADDTHAAKYFASKNRILLTYDGTIGVKTEYTISSGRSLVTAVERDGIRLIAVTINDANDWSDHKNLLTHVFSRAASIDLMQYAKPEYTVAVAGGRSVWVRSDITAPVTLIDEVSLVITSKVILPHFLYPNFGLLQRVGEVKIYANGRQIGSIPLRTYDTVPVQNTKKSLWELICGLF